MAQEEIRRGPWTENEDAQLILYVNILGDRRWDFIAKVSGLKRTGKSCRLRWVNYLHPGLRRGKLTAHEEQLVIEYQAKWGNRWSRIARKLPGRTDNEIKNYWRTHMRKNAQELKQASSSHWSTTSYSSSSPSSSSTSSINGMPIVDNKKRSFFDTGGLSIHSCLASNDSCSSFDTIDTKCYGMGGLEMLIAKPKKVDEEVQRETLISMDDIWKDIELSESEELYHLASEVMISPAWNSNPDSFPIMEEESKMEEIVFPPISDHFFAYSGLWRQ